MNYQTKAFQISFLLHGVIIVLVIMGGALVGQNKKTMVLDFDLQKPVSDVQKVESPTPSTTTKSTNPPARQVLKQKEFPRLAEEVPKISTNPETPPTVKLLETLVENNQVELGIKNNAVAVNESSSGIAGAAKEGSGPGIGNAGSGKESARSKYLNDHFAYIREKIFRNVSYPETARRMGWQGKVLLSFIIMADGSVRAVKILQGSGFTMLDNSAIETIKDTAPFPRPPVEAQLVIPIVYSLE